MTKIVPIPYIHLRSWRKRNKLTQEQAGNIISVSHNAYSEKERGIKPMTLEELEKLAAAYGAEPWMLLALDANDPRLPHLKTVADAITKMSEPQAQAFADLSVTMATAQK